MEANRQIVRTAGIVGGATLLSRVAGLVRDQVTAAFFGDGPAAAAFMVAFRIPNLLRRLLAEGALTVAFVPVFTHTLTTGGPEAARSLFRKMLTLLTLTLVLVCFLGHVFAPQVTALLAPGFGRDPGQMDLTVRLTRFLFPYIFFMGLGALFMGALNAGGFFAAPALGPVMGNLGVIAAAFVLTARLSPPILALAAGVLVGGFLHLAIQLPSLGRMGLKPRPDFRFRDPAVRKILVTMAPAALGAAVYQLSVFINTILASLLPGGSIPWLYYADRLMQFPLGVFTMAIGSAALPALSRLAASGDRAGFLASAHFALALSFFITAPAMAGLMALADPLVAFLFERGEFTRAGTLGTAQALKAYALGLPFLSGSGILARIFYSRHDTRTPTLVAAASLALGLMAALALMGPLKHQGLALASSLSSLANFLWLYIILARRERDFPRGRLAAEIAGYFALAVLMGAAVRPLSGWALAAPGFTALAGRTLASVAAGAGLYFGLALLTRRPRKTKSE
ncbi:MAG: murein biosynthesis integral membrane protein MurJ [Candidatus Adiutrix sp.]|jgi:putative peptidoglycan lipid II flippase|nr:murein biosynthesis integral membrane protein MurJ [Candidatus Adiutrix sp.]